MNNRQIFESIVDNLVQDTTDAETIKELHRAIYNDANPDKLIQMIDRLKECISSNAIDVDDLLELILDKKWESTRMSSYDAREFLFDNKNILSTLFGEDVADTDVPKLPFALGTIYDYYMMLDDMDDVDAKRDLANSLLDKYKSSAEEGKIQEICSYLSNEDSQLNAFCESINTYFEAASESNGDVEDDEPEENEEEADDENVDGGKKGGEDDALTKLYNVLSILIKKSNAYQNYHWNAESTSLHELSQSAYELYRDTYDKIAETIVALYGNNINDNVWGTVPSISNRHDFYESIDDDFEALSDLRDDIEQYKMFGVNSVIDGFIDELTTIKYKLIRFFENSEKVQ